MPNKLINANYPPPIAERIEEVVELTKSLTTIKDMAVLLGIEEKALAEELDDPCSPVAKAYRKAKAEIGLELRQREIALSRAGSPIATENVIKLFSVMD